MTPKRGRYCTVMDTVIEELKKGISSTREALLAMKWAEFGRFVYTFRIREKEQTFLIEKARSRIFSREKASKEKKSAEFRAAAGGRFNPRGGDGYIFTIFRR